MSLTCSVSAAARELGCSRPTVYEWMRTGKLEQIDGRPLAAAVSVLQATLSAKQAEFTVSTSMLASWTGKHVDDVLRDYKDLSILVGGKRMWREDDAVSLVHELAQFDADCECEHDLRVVGEELYCYDSRRFSFKRQRALLKGAPFPSVRRRHSRLFLPGDAEAIRSYLLQADEELTAGELACRTSMSVAQIYWMLHCAPMDRRLAPPSKRIWHHNSQLETALPYGTPRWLYKDVASFLEVWNSDGIELPDDFPADGNFLDHHASQVFGVGSVALSRFLAVPNWVEKGMPTESGARMHWGRVMVEILQQQLEDCYAPTSRAKVVPSSYFELSSCI